MLYLFVCQSRKSVLQQRDECQDVQSYTIEAMATDVPAGFSRLSLLGAQESLLGEDMIDSILQQECEHVARRMGVGVSWEVWLTRDAWASPG